MFKFRIKFKIMIHGTINNKIKNLRGIVSGSANGELITWDTNKLKMNETHKLDEINPELKERCRLISCATSNEYFICSKSFILFS